MSKLLWDGGEGIEEIIKNSFWAEEKSFVSQNPICIPNFSSSCFWNRGKVGKPCYGKTNGKFHLQLKKQLFCRLSKRKVQKAEYWYHCRQFSSKNTNSHCKYKKVARRILISLPPILNLLKEDNQARKVLVLEEWVRKFRVW